MALIQWLTAPSVFYRWLNKEPRWIPAFVMVTALTIITTIVRYPFTRQLALRHTAEGGITSANEAILHALHTSLLIGIVAAPIKIAVLWTFWSGVLYVVLSIGGNPLTFRQVLAIYGFAAILPAFDNLLGMSLNYIVGLEAITTPAAVISSLASLASLLPDQANQVTFNAAKEMNVSSVLLAIWLALGIGYQPKGRLLAGTAIAIGLLAIKIGISVGMSVIFRALTV
jgi:hypothetical protein